ncbi:MAG: hypothetical protein U0871_04750 [Gemmataceae bacterium]
MDPQRDGPQRQPRLFGDGAQEKPGVLERLAAYRAENVANRPKFIPEMAAEFREAREEVFANLIVAFPGSTQLAREPGGIGTPTPQMVTEALTGRDINPRTDTVENADVVELTPAPAAEQGQQQQQSRGRSR